MPRHDRILIISLAPIIVTVAAGCASSTPQRAPAENRKDPELERARAEADEAARARKQAEAQLEDTRRELDRVKKELDASRQTTSATQTEARLSQDLLLKQQKSYEAKIAFYKNLLAQGGSKAPDDAAIASTTAPQESAKKGGLDIDAPVAIVDGEAVPRRDLMEWLFINQAHTFLDSYLDTVLAQRAAKKLAIEVTDDEASRYALEKLAIITQQAGGEQALEAKLMAMSMTKDALLEVLRLNAKSSALVEKLVLYERQTPEGKQLLEQRAHAAFEQSFGERVEAKHLFIKLAPDATDEVVNAALETAKKKREQLALGEDWTKVAKATTTQAGLQAQADTTTFTRNQFAALPELERLFFDTKEGELSEPLRWRGGISIVKVEKRTPATARYEDKRDLLLSDLQKPEVSEEEVKALYARLRREAKIEKKLELR